MTTDLRRLALQITTQFSIKNDNSWEWHKRPPRTDDFGVVYLVDAATLELLNLSSADLQKVI